MSMDALKATFFAECEELVEAMTEGLQQIAEDDWDSETVNAIFRAVHSIKGSAGAFGFEALVAFAHRYETVLDKIRSSELEINADVLRVITRASDVLAELVELAQIEPDAKPAAYDPVMTDLDGFIGGSAEPVAESEVFAPLAFAALPLSFDEPETLRLEFAPDPAFYRNGHEPERFFCALGSEVGSFCDHDNVPLLAQFEADASYLRWTLTIEGKNKSEVTDAFEYAEGLGRIEFIDEAEPATEAPAVETTVAEIPPPVQIKTAKPRPASAQTLRIEPERVDRLINTVGELIINQAVIAQKIEGDGKSIDPEVASALDDYRYLAREIQEAVMSIRAQPVKSLFQRMARVVREAGEATGKAVSFETRGEATEIDKTLIERLADPLTHMLRNAVDHGLEAPDARALTEKSPTGTVTLSAAHRSGHVMIEVSDDGAGLDRKRILSKAIGNGLVAPDATLTDAEIDNLLFMPGFSTAEQVTNLSGRGVGMDVVKTSITSIGGRVSIVSEAGRGSTFTILLPLTLAVLDGIVVSVADETMVVPIATIVETIRATFEDVVELSPNNWVLKVRGAYVPIIDLAPLLGFGGARNTTGPFILVEAETGAVFAFAVDEIWDQRQIVIKSLEGNYGAIPGISAATILGDGQIALIIDPEALIALAGAAAPIVQKQKIGA